VQGTTPKVYILVCPSIRLAIQLSGMLMITFSSKCFGMDMSEGAGENVGRKEELLTIIIPTIPTNHGTSFHGHSVIYSVLYCTVLL
jgi:hypothetical protein